MNPVDALAAVGRVIADGMTLAAEILCPRDHTAEERLRSWESASVAVEDEICDEAEAVEFDCFDCGHCPACDPYDSSAADTAADPSPACPTPSPAGVGDEGPGPDSVIPQTVGPGQPNEKWDPNAILAELREGFALLGIDLLDDADLAQRFRDLAAAADPESDPREVSAPSLGDGRPTSELLMDASQLLAADTREAFALITELRERAEMFRGIEEL